MQRYPTTLTALAAVGAGLALAYASRSADDAHAAPAAYGSGGNYSSARGSAWGTKRILTTANTKYVVRTSTTTTNADVCLDYEELVVLKADGGNATCCWSMTSTLTLATAKSYDSAQTWVITDANDPATGGSYTAQGACFDLANGERVDQVPRYQHLSSAPGRRTGMCSSAVSREYTAWLPTTYPCRTNTDCPTGGGTCDTTTDLTQRLAGCAFLVCKGDTNSMTLAVRVER